MVPVQSATETASSDASQQAAEGKPNRDEEKRLVLLAIVRDQSAFAELYDRQDLTAQTFLKAWEAIDRYKERGAPFVAWLLRIAHNLTISHLRSKRDHSELDEGFVDTKRHGNPEESLEQASDERSVREAVLRLRDEQRQVIMLRFVEELDYTEVAAMIGKSVPAVRVIQHRALGNLRKLMQQ